MFSDETLETKLETVTPCISVCTRRPRYPRRSGACHVWGGEAYLCHGEGRVTVDLHHRALDAKCVVGALLVFDPPENLLARQRHDALVGAVADERV